MRILALESSCDESAVAVLDAQSRACWRTSFSARSTCTAPTAGWCRSWPPATMCGACCRWCGRALAAAATAPGELDGVAYTAGPGLIGALLTGAALGAQSGLWLGDAGASACTTSKGICSRRCWRREPPPFPHVALLVSGGHTHADRGVAPSATTAMLGARPRRCGRGGLRQDARSCSGCRIRAARSWRSWPRRDGPGAFAFPRPMLDRPGLEFSFSGLKTAVLQAVRGRELDRRRSARTSRAACRRRSSTP